MLQFDLIPTYLAWTFTHILPGTFKRNRPEFQHHDYPIVAPLPPDGNKQTPIEGSGVPGPFIYFVVDDRNQVFYVGKSTEAHILKRWIRPGNGGLAKHYWTHSTRAGGCVFNIAEGLRTGVGPFHLRFVQLKTLIAQFEGDIGLRCAKDATTALERAERWLIDTLKPAWNRR